MKGVGNQIRVTKTRKGKDMKSAPPIIRFCKSEKELELEEILASGLPSHGSARRDARNTVMLSGVSLTLVCKLISDATRKTISMKQVASTLQRKGVPTLEITFDDPLILVPDAADFERMNLPGIAGKAIDWYGIIKYFPELLHGAVDGDVFMPPRGMDILESVAAYANVKRNRKWKSWKRSINSRD